MNNGSYQGNNDGRKIAADSEVFLDSLSRAIINDNVTVIGWIANCISKDTLEINENINTLKSKLKFKLLDIIT